MNKNQIELVLKTLWKASPNAAEKFAYERTITADEVGFAKNIINVLFEQDDRVFLSGSNVVGERFSSYSEDLDILWLDNKSWFEELGISKADMQENLTQKLENSLKENLFQLKRDFLTFTPEKIFSDVLQIVWGMISNYPGTINKVSVQGDNVQVWTNNAPGLIGKGGETISKIAKIFERNFSIIDD